MRTEKKTGALVSQRSRSGAEVEPPVEQREEDMHAFRRSTFHHRVEDRVPFRRLSSQECIGETIAVKGTIKKVEPMQHKLWLLAVQLVQRTTAAGTTAASTTDGSLSCVSPHQSSITSSSHLFFHNTCTSSLVQRGFGVSKLKNNPALPYCQCSFSGRGGFQETWFSLADYRAKPCMYSP